MPFAHPHTARAHKPRRFEQGPAIQAQSHHTGWAIIIRRRETPLHSLVLPYLFLLPPSRCGSTIHISPATTTLWNSIHNLTPLLLPPHLSNQWPHTRLTTAIWRTTASLLPTATCPPQKSSRYVIPLCCTKLPTLTQDAFLLSALELVPRRTRQRRNIQDTSLRRARPQPC
jgi:hypothetical protein